MKTRNILVVIITTLLLAISSVANAKAPAAPKHSPAPRIENRHHHNGNDVRHNDKHHAEHAHKHHADVHHHNVHKHDCHKHNCHMHNCHNSHLACNHNVNHCHMH